MNSKVKQIFKIFLIIFLVLTAMAYWGEKAFYFVAEDDSLGEICYPEENVAVIKIQGEIVGYIVKEDADYDKPNSNSGLASSEEIIAYLNEANYNENIRAVILEINSYGGSPVASEEVMNAVKRLNKPSVAIIRGSGVSGAYLIASITNKIFSSEISDIGGIGITASYLDYSRQNQKEGITYQQISSGKFKDTGDPEKPLTAEEKELLMRDIRISHDFFVKKVAENRGLDIQKVKSLADGSTMLGIAAKENGLIDGIGGTEEAKTWLKEKLGVEPVLCFF